MKEKILIVACVLLVLFAGYRMFTSNLILGGEERPGVRVLDVETNEKFTIQIDRNFKGWPVRSPATGKMSGYPVEVCYHNLCGRKKGGTWVVLNENLGKPGATQCPECGHEVVPHNPLPGGHYVDPDGILKKRGG